MVALLKLDYRRTGGDSILQPGSGLLLHDRGLQPDRDPRRRRSAPAMAKDEGVEGLERANRFRFRDSEERLRGARHGRGETAFQRSFTFWLARLRTPLDSPGA